VGSQPTRQGEIRSIDAWAKSPPYELLHAPDYTAQQDSRKVHSSDPVRRRTIPVSASKTPIPETRGTESGTLCAQNAAQIDPDLRQIIGAWRDLPDAVKARILDVVRSEIHTPDTDRRRANVLDALRQAHSDDRQADATYPCDPERSP